MWFSFNEIAKINTLLLIKKWIIEIDIIVNLLCLYWVLIKSPFYNNFVLTVLYDFI